MNKIKICFISRRIYSLFNPNYNSKGSIFYGGAEVDIYLLAKELAKDKRFEINIISGDFGQKEIEIINNIQIFKSYRYEEKKLMHIVKLWNAMKKVNADIYFQEGSGGITGIICSFCKLYKKKFYFRIGSDIDCDKTFIENNLIEGFLYKWGLKNADKIIAQNKNQQSMLKLNHGLNSFLIKNLMKMPLYSNYRRKLILWIGRNVVIKRPEIFLEIANSIPNKKFFMICPEADIGNIEGIEKEAAKINNLIFIRQVPYKDIDKYFQKGQILVNTSDYEGFPNTFVQATANGTPIVSLNVNPDNFLTKYNCGFCSNSDLESMKKQIKLLLENKKLYNEMSKNAYKYSKENHDIKTIIPVYKKLFIDLMKKC